MYFSEEIHCLPVSLKSYSAKILLFLLKLRLTICVLCDTNLEFVINYLTWLFSFKTRKSLTFEVKINDLTSITVSKMNTLKFSTVGSPITHLRMQTGNYAHAFVKPHQVTLEYFLVVASYFSETPGQILLQYYESCSVNFFLEVKYWSTCFDA